MIQSGFPYPPAPEPRIACAHERAPVRLELRTHFGWLLHWCPLRPGVWALRAGAERYARWEAALMGRSRRVAELGVSGVRLVVGGVVVAQATVERAEPAAPPSRPCPPPGRP